MWTVIFPPLFCGYVIEFPKYSAHHHPVEEVVDSLQGYEFGKSANLSQW